MPLTCIETECLSAVKSAALKYTKEDRKQRRYEIAKDCLAGMLSSPNHGTHDWEMCVDLSIRCADKLLDKLDK